MFASTTRNGSHAPVDGRYVPSPWYLAWKPYRPVGSGPCAKPVASTVPFAVSAVGADVAVAAPAHWSFGKKSTSTLPPGVGCNGLGSLVVTATKSCTTDEAPALTTVTAPCAALWIVVAVCDARRTSTACDAAPTFG